VSNLISVLDDSGLVAVLDAYDSFEWTREYQGLGSFKLSIDANILAAAELIKGRRLLPPDPGIVYLIEQVQRDLTVNNNGKTDTLTVSGRGIVGMFTERVCLPPVGVAYDTQSSVNAETAVKHYVDYNAGASAASQRRIPNLTIATNLNRGATVTAQGRYNSLSDLITSMCKAGGLGCEIQYSAGNFVFDVISGADLSALVYFDVDIDTVLAQKWLSSDLGRKTYVYVAGQGVGAARTVVTGFSGASEPTGFNRRELFVDARDLSDSAALATRGNDKLALAQLEDSFEVTANPYGSFKYKTEWDLGSLVTMRCAKWQLTKTARVIKITQKLDNSTGSSPDIAIVLDKAFPTLKDAISNFVIAPNTAD
jgi:hypothetical protein